MLFAKSKNETGDYLIMIKLTPMTHEHLINWDQLHTLKIQGCPFADPETPLNKLVYHRTHVNLHLGVPPKWAYRNFIIHEAEKKVVGLIGFHTGPRAGLLEIGYSVSPLFRRQGIAKNALSTLLTQSVSESSSYNYLARISPDNTPSIRTAEQSGFRLSHEEPDESGIPRLHYILPAEEARRLYLFTQKIATT